MVTKNKRTKIPSKTMTLPVNCCITEKMMIRLNSLQTNSRLEWTLKEEQIAYIKTHYSYNVSPYLYRINTRKFKNSKKHPSIIKRITKGAYSGKRYIVVPLKKQDIEVLEEFEITYKPFKYIITTGV